MSDAIFEFYKRQVDREALRHNLELTVDQRLKKLDAELQSRTKRLTVPESSATDSNPGWEAISDCGSNRTSDPVVELYKRDVDRTLLRENLRRTVSERFLGLTRMADLHEAFRLGQKTQGANGE